MLELFRGIDIQLFADEGSVNEPAENQEVVDKKEEQVVAPESGDAQEEVIHDDDPVEILKKTAEELGINTDDLVFMDKKSFQSEIDRRITEAIKTREEKLRKEAEKKRLEEEGKYQELLRLEREEFLNAHKEALVKAYGIPSEFADLIDVASLSTKPFAEAKQELEQKFAIIKQKFDEYLAKKIEEQQKANQKGTVTPSNVASATADSLEAKLAQKFVR
jgi:hypothetical protein